MDLNELRKVAEAATPGPWTVMDVNDPGEGVNFIDVHQDGKSWEVVSRRLPDRHDDRDQMSADATHIATFDPPTVLALITRLEQAEQAVARVCTELGYIPESFSARIYKALGGDTRG